jgi:hypothetical protein
MKHQPLAIVATLVAVAACTPQQSPVAPEEYVAHGRFPAAMPREQALRECRLQLESAGRQSFPTMGPRELRQIPPPLPPAARPEYATIQACMDAKGYRRSAPSP